MTLSLPRLPKRRQASSTTWRLPDPARPRDDDNNSQELIQVGGSRGGGGGNGGGGPREDSLDEVDFSSNPMFSHAMAPGADIESKGDEPEAHPNEGKRHGGRKFPSLFRMKEKKSKQGRESSAPTNMAEERRSGKGRSSNPHHRESFMAATGRSYNAQRHAHGSVRDPSASTTQAYQRKHSTVRYERNEVVVNVGGENIISPRSLDAHEDVDGYFRSVR